MRLAYLILAHKNIDQLARMINALAHENVTFFLHIDSKASFNEEDFLASLKSNVDMYLLEPRVSMTWGGFRLVETTIHLLSLCLDNCDADYISLISGQDFPLRPHNELCAHLQTNYGKEFVDHQPVPDNIYWNGYFGTTRYEKFWMVDEIGINNSKILVNRQLAEGIFRKFPYEMKPYGGSQWFTITSKCARYILDFLNNHPDYLPFFRFTLVPDEIFFVSIVANSDFKDRIINNNLRYIDWHSGPEHPRLLTDTDYNLMKQSGSFFARKFENFHDSNILDILEAKLKIENSRTIVLNN